MMLDCWYRSISDCLQTFLHDYCQLNRPPHRHNEPVDLGSFITMFSAMFVLQVLGAIGAIWGFSEVLQLRDASNSVSFWRPVAVWTGVVFFVRFWIHGKHYLEQGWEFPPIKSQHRHHKKPFVQIFSSKFILEVMGGGGAIWGSSEVVRLRDSDTVWFWRPASKLVVLVFGITWMLEMVAYCRAKDENRNPIIRWYRVLIARFILDVLGGAGAIWGSSEALGARTINMLSFWRPVAIFIGVVFFFRWLWQLRVFLADERSYYEEISAPADEEQAAIVSSHELQLSETSAA